MLRRSPKMFCRKWKALSWSMSIPECCFAWKFTISPSCRFASSFMHSKYRYWRMLYQKRISCCCFFNSRYAQSKKLSRTGSIQARKILCWWEIPQKSFGLPIFHGSSELFRKTTRWNWVLYFCCSNYSEIQDLFEWTYWSWTDSTSIFTDSTRNQIDFHSSIKILLWNKNTRSLCLTSTTYKIHDLEGLNLDW